MTDSIPGDPRLSQNPYPMPIAESVVFSPCNAKIRNYHPTTLIAPVIFMSAPTSFQLPASATPLHLASPMPLLILPEKRSLPRV